LTFLKNFFGQLRIDSRPPEAVGRTAVYNIEGRVVYLPNGEKLEAHSGFGKWLDDTHYVSEKARGPTPPNVYRLTLRKALFHGVQAIRLNPISGSKMYGRSGFLAHPLYARPRWPVKRMCLLARLSQVLGNISEGGHRPSHCCALF
jgi:hypothetical protein